MTNVESCGYACMNLLSHHLCGGAENIYAEYQHTLLPGVLLSHLQHPLKICELLFKESLTVCIVHVKCVWVDIRVNVQFWWKIPTQGLSKGFLYWKYLGATMLRNPYWMLGYVIWRALAECATIEITEAWVLRLVWSIDLLFNLLCVLWTSLTMTERDSDIYIYIHIYIHIYIYIERRRELGR
jgi:hypothetical protein